MANTIAPDVDRLPWLTDDVRRPRRSTNWVVAFVAASAVAIIAALSFWLGMSGTLRLLPNTQRQAEPRFELPSTSAPSETVLPEPAMPQVEPVPVSPQVALPAQEDVRMEAPPVRRVARKAAAAHRSKPVAGKSARAKATTSTDADSRYASPWESSGVSGRMVRVGAYSSLEKGKEAWSRLAQLSPAIKQLPAVVTDLPSKSGRVYYWLQIGTTSQAHSEVLCQRMRAIRQSCVVVDLAGARKGSRDERQPAGV